MQGAATLRRLEGFDAEVEPWESFERSGNSIRRVVHRRAGGVASSTVGRGADVGEVADAHDASWLRLPEAPPAGPSRSSLTIADLFSGCGGLSLGAWEACRALNIRPRFVLASDLNRAALDVYSANLRPQRTLTEPLETVLDGQLAGRLTKSEKGLRDKIGAVDLTLAGPPCQGHSDLNNHTRRADEKNRLVLKVARFVEVFEPRHVLIENVQGIRHDRFGAIELTSRRLEQLGYRVTQGIVDAHSVGVPQGRRRFFLYASTGLAHPFAELENRFPHSGRDVAWAIRDLTRLARGRPYDEPSVATPVNARRIDYLFDNGLYDLPDGQRPSCHADGQHSYRAVYGRLRWNLPAPTITTGFGCMGQGRYVHPSERRTLTPHEAARLQSFPDFFRFGERKRGEYQQLIGNAVPPKLAYAVLLHQLA